MKSKIASSASLCVIADTIRERATRPEEGAGFYGWIRGKEQPLREKLRELRIGCLGRE